VDCSEVLKQGTGASNMVTSIPIRLGERTYEVAVGHHLLTQLPARITDALGSLPSRVLLVVDIGASKHADSAEHALHKAGSQTFRLDITPTEKIKTLDTFGRILSAAAEAGLERSHPIIAIGGGIIGDVAGFAASAYRRGVPSVLCPTTLLSMVDASVGGKTGVNLANAQGHLLKNMAGSFHQPALVLADMHTLTTLPQRHQCSGLAECVKHAMLSADFNDPQAMQWIYDHRQQILDMDADTIGALVVSSVRLKASIVEQDEREEASISSGGGRARLNLGHTFAHAMETICHLSPTGYPADASLQHGEAVALGLVAASHAAWASGVCGPQVPQSTTDLLKSLGLPVTVHRLPPNEELIERMQADKKVAGGKLRLVLPTGPGSAKLFDNCPPEGVAAGWNAIRA
jgi:3-dehydroquinate synthase